MKTNRAFKSSFRNYLSGVLLNIAFSYWTVKTNLIDVGPIKIRRFIKEVILLTLFIDTWFYWAHRLLHTKYFYSFHREHHSFRPTTTLSYVAMSIPEYFGENLSYYFLPPFIWKILGSKLHIKSWAFSNFLVAVWAAIFHSNALSFTLKKFNINGPKEHTLHHQFGMKNHNFSLLFLHWDRLCGTYKETESLENHN